MPTLKDGCHLHVYVAFGIMCHVTSLFGFLNLIGWFGVISVEPGGVAYIKSLRH